MDRLNLTPLERAIEAILMRDQDQPFYVVARRIAALLAADPPATGLPLTPTPQLGVQGELERLRAAIDAKRSVYESASLIEYVDGWLTARIAVHAAAPPSTPAEPSQPAQNIGVMPDPYTVGTPAEQPPGDIEQAPDGYHWIHGADPLTTDVAYAVAADGAVVRGPDVTVEAAAELVPETEEADEAPADEPEPPPDPEPVPPVEGDPK